MFLCFSALLALRLPRIGQRELILVLFVEFVWFCLSSLPRCLRRAAACDCGTPWTFLLPFCFMYRGIPLHPPPPPPTPAFPALPSRPTTTHTQTLSSAVVLNVVLYNTMLPTNRNNPCRQFAWNGKTCLFFFFFFFSFCKIRKTYYKISSAYFFNQNAKL